jgi:hypothetical protein
MRTREWMVAATLAAMIAPAASAAVFKCRGADGALTYQQLPCDSNGVTVASDIASEYPAPNVLERERVLTREAELYKRLEAQRERLSAEAIARISRPEPVAIAAEPVGYAIAWPVRHGHRAQRRAPMHGWAWQRR